jgi:hypothetical protein
VGDSAHVVVQLEAALQKNGIPVVRISGKTDTEKSIALYSKFAPVFSPKAVVAVGRDALDQIQFFQPRLNKDETPSEDTRQQGWFCRPQQDREAKTIRRPA